VTTTTTKAPARIIAPDGSCYQPFSDGYFDDQGLALNDAILRDVLAGKVPEGWDLRNADNTPFVFAVRGASGDSLKTDVSIEQMIGFWTQTGTDSGGTSGFGL
jgi:hypothetical protein